MSNSGENYKLLHMFIWCHLNVMLIMLFLYLTSSLDVKKYKLNH
jgi:hypothetical protein